MGGGASLPDGNEGIQHHLLTTLANPVSRKHLSASAESMEPPDNSVPFLISVLEVRECLRNKNIEQTKPLMTKIVEEHLKENGMRLIAGLSDEVRKSVIEGVDKNEVGCFDVAVVEALKLVEEGSWKRLIDDATKVKIIFFCISFFSMAWEESTRPNNFSQFVFNLFADTFFLAHISHTAQSDDE